MVYINCRDEWGICTQIPTQGEIFQILEKNNLFKIHFLKKYFTFTIPFHQSLLQITLCFTTLIRHAPVGQMKTGLMLL